MLIVLKQIVTLYKFTAAVKFLFPLYFFGFCLFFSFYFIHYRNKITIRYRRDANNELMKNKGLCMNYAWMKDGSSGLTPNLTFLLVRYGEFLPHLKQSKCRYFRFQPVRTPPDDHINPATCRRIWTNIFCFSFQHCFMIFSI